MENGLVKQLMINVMEKESQAIAVMMQTLNGTHEKLVDILYRCAGKIVFMGIGKSGHIGRKLAATFASTGSPSFFVHCAEACHGDFGMIEKKDIAVLISNSGNTQEVVQTIPFLKNIGCATVAFTSNSSSKLASGCDMTLLIPKLAEADHLNLAPTVSSTLTLVMGDAIACALCKLRDFRREDFYRFHPGGALGTSLAKENR